MEDRCTQPRATFCSGKGKCCVKRGSLSQEFPLCSYSGKYSCLISGRSWVEISSRRPSMLRFFWPSAIPLYKFRNSAWNLTAIFHSTFFTIHYSLIILPFDTKYSGLQTALLQLCSYISDARQAIQIHLLIGCYVNYGKIIMPSLHWTNFPSLQPAKWWIRDEVAILETKDMTMCYPVMVVALLKRWWQTWLEQCSSN